MSHSGCHPVIDSVMGERLDSPADIARIAKKVRAISFYGIIQSDLTFSGVEIALWDLLGQAKELPVYKLLGYEKSERKLPYASVLFGDTPEETRQKALAMRKVGFSAIKFGWGPYGRGSVKVDAAHVLAAREGVGSDAHLMIDAGTIFKGCPQGREVYAIARSPIYKPHLHLTIGFVGIDATFRGVERFLDG